MQRNFFRLGVGFLAITIALDLASLLLRERAAVEAASKMGGNFRGTSG